MREQRLVAAEAPLPIDRWRESLLTAQASAIIMNSAGAAQEQSMLRLLYHTARLLPRYAFPVGLDIVDKYAKIAGLPGTEPTAMRVGIYSVIPGEQKLDEREGWALQPFVVGDIIDKNTGIHMDDDDQIDLRRLGEAVRYTLEPLTGLRFIETTKDVNAIFSHGPLINQFAMYDEAEPNFIPFLKHEFLSDAGIEHSDVEQRVRRSHEAATESACGGNSWPSMGTCLRTASTAGRCHQRTHALQQIMSPWLVR